MTDVKASPQLYDRLPTMLSRQPLPLSAFLADVPEIRTTHQLKHLLTRLANRLDVLLVLTADKGVERVAVHRDSWPRVEVEQGPAAARLEL